uniref:Uncharacterized protein n=1 Tax=Romanomermis culicivorax TaxID=13658 RepID=A0A915I5M8_ROMCU
MTSMAQSVGIPCSGLWAAKWAGRACRTGMPAGGYLTVAVIVGMWYDANTLVEPTCINVDKSVVAGIAYFSSGGGIAQETVRARAGTPDDAKRQLLITQTG